MVIWLENTYMALLCKMLTKPFANDHDLNQVFKLPNVYPRVSLFPLLFPSPIQTQTQAPFQPQSRNTFCLPSKPLVSPPLVCQAHDKPCCIFSPSLYSLSIGQFGQGLFCPDWWTGQCPPRLGQPLWMGTHTRRRDRAKLCWVTLRALLGERCVRCFGKRQSCYVCLGIELPALHSFKLK